jgi:hypothetical protein
MTNEMRAAGWNALYHVRVKTLAAIATWITRRCDPSILLPSNSRGKIL